MTSVARARALTNWDWDEGDAAVEQAANDYVTPDHRRYFTVAGNDDGFLLERGNRLDSVTVAYETYGELNHAGDNAIIVLHALTGDSHVASHGPDDRRAGWWEGMVGPGMALDTNRYFVVCANMLGGCRGTTGPATIDPETGRAYGRSFPSVTVGDMVRLQKLLLDHLGVRRLQLACGGSMGGMQALEWAVAYPDFVAATAIIAAPARSPAQSIAYNVVARRAIMLDPKWRGGEYATDDGPEEGLGIARMIGMITYQSEPSMERKFGRAAAADGRYRIDHYLAYQGNKLARRFDPNSYLCLIEAIDGFDIGRGRGGVRRALAQIKSRVLLVGIDSDILYPAYLVRKAAREMGDLGVSATYVELSSPFGHDAFLIEVEKVQCVIATFLDGKQDT